MNQQLNSMPSLSIKWKSRKECLCKWMTSVEIGKTNDYRLSID